MVRLLDRGARIDDLGRWRTGQRPRDPRRNLPGKWNGWPVRFEPGSGTRSRRSTRPSIDSLYERYKDWVPGKSRLFFFEGRASRELRGPAGREGEGRNRESLSSCRAAASLASHDRGGYSVPRAPSDPPGRCSRWRVRACVRASVRPWARVFRPSSSGRIRRRERNGKDGKTKADKNSCLP